MKIFKYLCLFNVSLSFAGDFEPNAFERLCFPNDSSSHQRTPNQHVKLQLKPELNEKLKNELNLPLMQNFGIDNQTIFFVLNKIHCETILSKHPPKYVCIQQHQLLKRLLSYNTNKKIVHFTSIRVVNYIIEYNAILDGQIINNQCNLLSLFNNQCHESQLPPEQQELRVILNIFKQKQFDCWTSKLQTTTYSSNKNLVDFITNLITQRNISNQENIVILQLQHDIFMKEGFIFSLAELNEAIILYKAYNFIKNVIIIEDLEADHFNYLQISLFEAFRETVTITVLKQIIFELMIKQNEIILRRLFTYSTNNSTIFKTTKQTNTDSSNDTPKESIASILNNFLLSNPSPNEREISKLITEIKRVTGKSFTQKQIEAYIKHIRSSQ